MKRVLVEILAALLSCLKDGQNVTVYVGKANQFVFHNTMAKSEILEQARKIKHRQEVISELKVYTPDN
ncbi:hypothetical protein KEM09_12060 [Carboxylicivirga mesophila]|uniref:Uncharacterized protein n=1 Tax=Carboxylicivirga mesophila TaxID=1166478 RepID=A0ABS5KAU2_9BACT|nr:hypothetical protein [Carboxylicivirga mesophila]MBS2212144.1 hypothetical protein [Carboxylicivirga mesophila]